MSDLVARLRTMAGIGWNPIGAEAADRIEAQAKRVAELEAALHDAAELAFERRDEAEKAAKRIAELEAALKADCDAQAQAEAGQRIAELEAALRKAIAFYDALETPHAPGEPALLDELTGILQSH